MSGNMYENIVTWNPLAGECIHKCSYCYMETMRKRYNNPKWCGEPRIDEKALDGFKPRRGSTVFVQSINDLFADNVPDEMIAQIIKRGNEHRRRYGVRFLFQSRNVRRMSNWSNLTHLDIDGNFPVGSLVGTTIETDDTSLASGPSSPFYRAKWLSRIFPAYEKFITIEPIMKFDIRALMPIIMRANPSTVNIGANSKGGASFPEPTAEEVLALIRELESRGIEVIQKSNLARILKGTVK